LGWEEMEEEGVIDLKRGRGISHGREAVWELADSQLLGGQNGLRVYRRQVPFPVRGLRLLDSMKVFVLEVPCVVEVGEGRELPAPSAGRVESAA